MDLAAFFRMPLYWLGDMPLTDLVYWRLWARAQQERKEREALFAETKRGS